MREIRHFAVGDKVYVDTGQYDSVLTGPFTIEKQHKNGNLIVQGQQYRTWGFSCAGSRWSSRSRLLLRSANVRSVLGWPSWRGKSATAAFFATRIWSPRTSR